MWGKLLKISFPHPPSKKHSQKVAKGNFKQTDKRATSGRPFFRHQLFDFVGSRWPLQNSDSKSEPCVRVDCLFGV